MAFSKFIKLSSFACIIFIESIYSNPIGEYCELKATRAESPRYAFRVIEAGNQPRPERCCWSILSAFCTLMGNAGSSYPHPIIRQS